MRRGFLSPTYMEKAYPDGLPDGFVSIEVWSNEMYEATAMTTVEGWVYLTLKRHDRRAVRDWRHLQSIKNEIAGPERIAIEIFPPEEFLIDEANQYHLWVLPEGEDLAQMFRYRAVGDAEFTQGRTRGEHKGRQRPWQPGLSTGPGVC